MAKKELYKDWIVRYYGSHNDIPPGHTDGELTELIRCRDCRHWYKAQNEDEYSACAIWFDSYGDCMQDTNENGYCHRAERKEE